ncbi:glycosyltransferase family 2 protein [[Eubacterium] cellulosolvens]
MRLVVTIPAYNEEKTIGKVIKKISRTICDEVKIIVIDDGSKDDTIKVAKTSGADVIHSFGTNRGLAQTFKKGLDLAIGLSADLIVNIDADAQYDPKEIPKLIQPIIEDEADIVLGSRFKGKIEYMSKKRKIGNLLATKVTSFLSGINISDAQTGFRALAKEAALRLCIISEYTYTQEMIIQAVHKGMRIIEVPCTFKKRKGSSRLISGLFSYARRAGMTIIRTYMDYKPLRVFLFIGASISLLGLLIGFRVLIHFLMTGTVTPFIPSAILTAVLLIVGFQIITLGLIADMVSRNRRLTEEILYRLKKRE